jgi:hypothetical protein
MTSVRNRLEQRELAERYAARAPRQSTEEIAAARKERLEANATVIHQQNLEIFLHSGDATEDEIEVVKSQIGAESPQHLANVDVYNAKLLKLRVNGQAALTKVLDSLDDDVRQEVLTILATKGPEARTGADQGAGARAAVQEYFER